MPHENAIIEAALFMENAPVSPLHLSTVSGIPVERVTLILAEIAEKLRAESSGIALLETKTGFLLSPKKELWDELRAHYGKKNEQRLSKSAMETLSIIAYKQPVTRAEIEQIRGVSADNMISLLTERDLIREAGKRDAPGKPVQYATTHAFLELFHLNSISDLRTLAPEDPLSGDTAD